MKCRALLTLLVLQLTGCSSDPARLFLSAAAGINPDQTGHPAPVEVWLYALKSPEAFERADFFDLYLLPDNPLDGTVLQMTRQTLRTEQTQQLERELPAQTRYLGIVVCFRNINASQWRQVIPIDPAGDPVIHVEVDRSEVRIGSGGARP